MGSRYPLLRCPECGCHSRMLAVCENPDTENETRFYECSARECRYAFQACVPTLESSGWIGLRDDFNAMHETDLPRP